MTIKGNGFTMANGPEGHGRGDEIAGRISGSLEGADQQQEEDGINAILALVNRLLAAFGQQRLPNDTDQTNLLERLEEAVSYVEKFKQSSSNVAMRNRLSAPGPQQRFGGSSQLLTDAEVAERLRANGVDPAFMPRTDGTYALSNADAPLTIRPAITIINQILKRLSQPTLPVDTRDENLDQKLRELYEQIKEGMSLRSSTPAAAMTNRQPRRSADGLLSDDEVAERLRARGIDPKFMPRSGR